MFFEKTQTVQPIPTYDVGMNAPPTPQQPVYEQLDPLAAAQLSRNWEQDPSAVGVAQITVDNRRIIEEFKARLRGYIVERRFDFSTGMELEPQVKKFGLPLMNEEGINHLCGILESALSKNIMLSNIPTKDERWIKQVCRTFWRTIALQIAVNSQHWQVDRSRRDILPMEMSLLLHANYMRAFEDGERRKLYPGQKHVTTTMINPAQLQPEKRQLISF